jgi:hypothetical protein
VWTRCSWLQIGTNGGLLWTLQWTSVILKVFYSVHSLWHQTRFNTNCIHINVHLVGIKRCHAAVNVLVPWKKYMLSGVAERLWCSENERCWLRLVVRSDVSRTQSWIAADKTKAPNVAYWNWIVLKMKRIHTHTHIRTCIHTHTHTHTYIHTYIQCYNQDKWW